MDATKTPVAAPRGKLDPITKPLWRYPRAERTRLMEPFVGEQIRIDRWFGRVAAIGDQQYEGTLLAVATTTTGSNADLLILKTTAGTVWALSTAQVYYVELLTPRRRAK